MKIGYDNMTFLKKIFSLLRVKDKNLLLGLVLFSIIISIIETVGISVIMPFIQVATDLTIIEKNEYFLIVYNTLGFTNKSNFILAFGALLILFYIFRSFINYIYFYALAKYAQGRYHILASNLFKKYLKMPYKEFIKNNSSSLSKSIITEAQLLTTIIIALLMILSELFVIILIYSVILYIDRDITIFLTILLAANGLIILKIISPKIKQSGIDRAKYQQIFYELINKSFGNYKMIKLHSLEDTMYRKFINTSSNFVLANIKNQSLSNFPRLFLEAISFSIVIVIVIYLVKIEGSNTTAILAKVTIFVLALYRLMPSFNRVINAYNQILFNHKALDIIYENMNYSSEILGEENISFNSFLKLENICFKYNKLMILDNLNITINKAEKIAIIGESGSGKSTLVDIIIGLNRPILGNIIVDGIHLDINNLSAWRDKIGYIPQQPYLFDGTVGENIAFSSNYDKNKVDEALKQAQIYDIFLDKNEDKTYIGENGITLSGGQRQRIAIARALYKNPEILVLDEATSALDYDTERKIMEEIYEISKDKTLIVVAHRLSTIEGCDKIIELNNGNIINIKLKKELS